jgi:ribosomal protein L23
MANITITNSWKKEKSFSIKNSGYHTYFGLSASALSNDVEFEVNEDATKTQIKSAFAKSLKNKKMNKKILGEFVQLIV